MAAIFQTTFQMLFPEWKYINFDYDFIEVCSKGPINNIIGLVQMMTWRQAGVKPLSEQIMVSLLTHIYAPLGLNAVITGFKN